MGFNVGENIKKFRKLKGLTQKELAEKLGITQQSVAQYERTNKLPKLETLLYIANALDITLNGLLFGESDLESEKALEKAMEETAKWNDKIVKRALIEHYNKLNKLGREKAVERVYELTQVKEYTEKSEYEKFMQNMKANKPDNN